MPLLGLKPNPQTLVQILFIVLFSCIVIVRLADTDPILGSDSYVYLNTAINFTQGEIAQTDIIYFDTERSHGTAPAPLTTFPAGYSFLISILIQIGIPADWAGVAISLAGILLSIIFVNRICLQLKLGITAQIIANAILIANNLAIEYAGIVLTEPLFTGLIAAALFCLIKALSEKGFGYEKFGYLLLCHLFIGLSYWVRYAGIFFFLAVAIFHLTIFIIYRNRQNFLAGFFTLLSFSFLAAGFIRNFLLVGTWKGGNDKHVDGSLTDALQNLLRIFYQLLFGGSVKATLGAFEVLIIICTLALTLLAIHAIFFGRERPPSGSQMQHPTPKSLTVLMITIFVGAYSAAMVYAGVTTVITYSSRMFFPLLPALALAAAMAVDSILISSRKEISTLLLTVLIICYGAINARNILVPHNTERHEQLDLILGSTLSDNKKSLKTVLTEGTHPEQTIIANSSNALNYVLDRRILAIPFREYSSKEWSLDTLKMLAKQYSSRYLVLFKDDQQILTDHAFLLSLGRGTHPKWLQPIYISNDVALYEIMH